MKFKFLKGAAACALAVGMTLGLTACSNQRELPGSGKKFDNETDPLTFSTEALDGVFSPFFATSGTDSAIASMTQIGMLSNDTEGKVTYGNDYEVAALDYWTVEEGETEDVDLYTTYYFVLKPNIKFSDGSPLTIRDVLFNFYVYLDPAYYGSNTIYSTDIVGLQEYRTQSASKEEQESANSRFSAEADDIIQQLDDIGYEVFHNKPENANMTDDEFNDLIYASGSFTKADLQDLYKNAKKFFREELETDYSNSIDSAEDIVLEDKNGKTYKPFTTDVEAFLYNKGILSWNEQDGQVESTATNDPKEVKSWTKDQAINTVYNSNIPSKISEVVYNDNLREYEIAALREKYYKEHQNEIKYKSISGIEFANRDKDITRPAVPGKGIEAQTYKKIGAGTGNAVGANTENYNADGTPKAGFNEVLSIKIKNRDPKAVWNFGIGIAPMWYYSNKEQNEAFDYTSHFGVEYNSRSFMDNVVKDPDKTGVPVGAGPYAASTAAGGVGTRTSSDTYGAINGVTRGKFHEKNVVYFERNEYYNMANTTDGKARIKKVRFQVGSANSVKNSLYSGEIDFVEPKADTDTLNELKGVLGAGVKNIQTNGYGYIGVNAGKVPSLKIRQAIMHAINVKSCVDYYKGQAKIIYRSMSKSSWAYPNDAISYYPYIGDEIPVDNNGQYREDVNPDYFNFVKDSANSKYIVTADRNGDGKSGDALNKEGQLAFLRQLVKDAHYVDSGSTAYTHQSYGDKLEYRFTVVGSETDHPAWNALIQAGQLLNETGCFNITVKTDAQGLSKLGSGDLTVWAAAWGSTIDPDMYQVYHRDSEATSVWNWGYREIKNNASRYSEEQELLDLLSEQIDLGRRYLEEDQRKQYYYKALDYVMQLAIELPTYQRDDLFAWNDYKIDGSTLYADANAFLGLTSQMYNISLRIS